MPTCAVCMHLGLPPRIATGSIGLLSSSPALRRAAVDHLGDHDGVPHVVVNACPEHVVDVYRGRLHGVRMAWRVAPTGIGNR